MNRTCMRVATRPPAWRTRASHRACVPARVLPRGGAGVYASRHARNSNAGDKNIELASISPALAATLPATALSAAPGYTTLSYALL